MEYIYMIRVRVRDSRRSRLYRHFNGGLHKVYDIIMLTLIRGVFLRHIVFCGESMQTLSKHNIFLSGILICPDFADIL